MTEAPLLDRYERELAWRDHGMITLVAPGDVAPHRYGLPAPLIELAAKLESTTLVGHSVTTTCTDAIAAELTSGLWRRARELVRRGELDVELPTSSPQAIAAVIQGVVTSAFEFDAEHASLRSRGRRMFEVLRRGSALRIARRAIGDRGGRAVCLEYAIAMQVLYAAVKRVTPSLARTFLVPIGGRAIDFTAPEGHAWNWLVDANARSIVVFDACAPAALARWQHWHVSAFIATLYDRVFANVGLEDFAALVAAVIDVTTERGRTLLYHFANHLTVAPTTRRRIARYLTAGAFEAVVPEWREQLTVRDRQRGPLEWILAHADARDEALFGALAEPR